MSLVGNEFTLSRIRNQQSKGDQVESFRKLLDEFEADYEIISNHAQGLIVENFIETARYERRRSEDD